MAEVKNQRDVESERLLAINWQTQQDGRQEDDQRHAAAIAKLQPATATPKNIRIPNSLAIDPAGAADATSHDALAQLDAIAGIKEEFDPRAELDATIEDAIESAAALRAGPCASVRLDEVFNAIAAYRAIVDNRLPAGSLLAASLRAQANAIFNQAFINLQARYGYAELFADAPLGDGNEGRNDITAAAIGEVERLQRVVRAA